MTKINSKILTQTPLGALAARADEAVAKAAAKAAVEDEVQVKTATAETVETVETVETGEDETIFYVSRHPSIVVYVNIPGKAEIGKNGERYPISHGIEFKNGVFQTANPMLIALLDERAGAMRQIYRRERDLRKLAILRETHKQDAMLKRGTVAGAASSGDGDAADAARATAHLNKLRNKTFNGAG